MQIRTFVQILKRITLMLSTAPEEFFKNFIKSQPSDFFQLPQSGSARKNFIGEFQNEKFIITENENVEENNSFLYFSEVFEKLHLNTPKILAISADRTIYIQSFLGSETLSEIISKEGLSENVKSLVKQTLQKLYQLQSATKNQIDFSKTFEYQAYDELPISHDLFYFKFMFADLLEVQYHKSKLLKEFKKLVALVESCEPKGVMIRDFQSRNIMVNSQHQISFIDYQSAMKGPLMYDVISFLYQAKANFSEDFKAEMLDYYCRLWNDKNTVEDLQKSLKPLQLMRFLQVLGAYGYRGIVQKKPHFIQSISQGVDNVFQFSENWQLMSDFPELKKVIDQLYKSKNEGRINSLHQ